MIILWHHQDLRISDHPILDYVSRQKLSLCPLYIDDNSVEWNLGKASRWWLDKSLASLKKDYQKHGSNLFITKGPALDFFKTLHIKHTIKEICWLERIEPSVRKRDQIIKKSLEEIGIKITVFKADTLSDLSNIKNKQNDIFKVFTPFYKALCKEIDGFSILQTPKLPPPPKISHNFFCNLEAPILNNLSKYWKPGRDGAIEKLKYFCDKNLSTYSKNRDFPAIDETSKLSPYLHFGEISIREVWQSICLLKENKVFLQELAWREFSNYFLFHNPQTSNTSWKSEFEKFAWKTDIKSLENWQKGETGYPIVDAGMKQLLQTGWMHNRLRMIVGSFLTKDLMIHWIEGAKWFWENLVDADLAANTMGWQWVAGCGADAAPYFRIFNPSLQAKKFDPDAEYIKKYISNLKQVSKNEIHQLPELGKPLFSGLNNTYIKPIVNHNIARNAALEKYKNIKD
jgi:deoxyribodipyrimidine photo-lyase